MEIRKKGSPVALSDSSPFGFGTALTVLAGLIVFAIIGQNVVESVSGTGVKILIGIIALISFLFIFHKPLWKVLDTPYLAISSLLCIAFGTAAGTFVTQNALPENFRLRYGDTESSILEFLQLNDVFHSWWYIGLFVVMCGSLIKVSRNKGFNRNTWGFHLAHLSPVIILLGFWIDYFYGFRGIIPLEVDQVTNEATLYKDHTNYTSGTAILPFQLRLDHFASERHDPDYRLQIWKNESENNTQADAQGQAAARTTPAIKASFPLEHKKIRKIYGTDVRFWMLDFYPNFTFDYSYPENIDTISPEDPGVLLDVKTKIGEATVQLRQNRKGQGKLSDPSMGASLEFYWDPPDDAFTPLEKEQKDTAFASAHADWATMGRIIFSGKNKKIYYVAEEGITEETMVKDKFYPFPNKTDEGYTFRYLFPDAKYLQGVPATRDEKLENPVAKVQLWGGPVDPPKTVYLYPGLISKTGTFSVPESDYFIALESFKEMETKYWKSDLSIIDDNGEAIKSTSIQVNEPFNYKGYRMYQSDYDPANPKYSGIGITYTPGLYIVYLGFMLMVLGTLILFYWRSKVENIGTANNNL